MAIALPRDLNRITPNALVDSVTGLVAGWTGFSFSGVEAGAVAIVDGSGVQITSFGGGTQYTDAGTPPAHPVGPTLLFNNSGTWASVSAANPLPVTGGGGGTQYADGATFTQGTSLGNLSMGTYQSSHQTLTTGKSGAIAVDINRNTLTNIATKLDSTNDSVTASNTTGNVASAGTDSGNPVKVGGVYNSTQPTFTNGQRGDLQLGSRGSLRTELFGPSSASGAAVISPGSDGASVQQALQVNTQPYVYNGSTYDRQRSAPGGTGTMAIGGLTASGSSIAVAPITHGGQAKTANPTAVADGQVVNATYDKLGKQVVVGSIRDLKGRQTTTITASTSETTIVTAVASTFLDIYGLVLANSGATATTVQLRDSTAGTVLGTFYVPAGDTRGFMLPESAALAQTTVNNNWTAQCGSSTSSMIVTALYVKNI